MASPFLWGMKAEELQFAAELIWTSVDERLQLINQFAAGDIELDFKTLNSDTFSIFLSLIGFSTESLFKGIIIRNNPTFVSDGKLFKKLKTHDLIKLSKLAKLPLSQHE